MAAGAGFFLAAAGCLLEAEFCALVVAGAAGFAACVAVPVLATGADFTAVGAVAVGCEIFCVLAAFGTGEVLIVACCAIVVGCPVAAGAVTVPAGAHGPAGAFAAAGCAAFFLLNMDFKLVMAAAAFEVASAPVCPPTELAVPTTEFSAPP